MLHVISLVFVFLLPTAPVQAQLIEDFADGELTSNPAWGGDLTRWKVVQDRSGFALRSAGPAVSDTLYLSTASTAAFGRWSFTFGYEDVNLSNFNGSRVFLIADAADLTGEVHGYYLQFGANNTDQIGFYRQDGDAATRRVLLGRSESPLLTSGIGRIAIEVLRTVEGQWSVWADSVQIVSLRDDTYAESTHFGLWVKHTAAAAGAYWFDEFRIESETTPDDALPPIPPGAVVINEIMYEPLSDPEDGRPEQPEYVELFNRTDQAYSLRGLYLTVASDADSETDTVYTGRLGVLDAHGYAVVFAQSESVDDPASQSTLAQAFPEGDFADPSVSLLPVRRSTLGLNNTGDLIRLYNREGILLDDVPYDPDWHHPGLAETKGIALERISPDLPSDAANWNSSPHPSGGTPGRRNSVHASPGEPAEQASVNVSPSPFSPDDDGFDDHTVISYSLSNIGGTIRVRIFDSKGRLVRNLEPAGLAGRSGELTWDGLDDAGRSLPIGIYIVLLEAVFHDLGKAERLKDAIVLARRLN